MTSISAMYATWTASLLKDGRVDPVLRAHARRIVVDDVQQYVDVQEAALAVSVVGAYLNGSPTSRAFRCGILPLLHEHICHGEPEAKEGKPTPKYGPSLGAGLRPLVQDDSNGSVSRACLRIFQAADVYEFLSALRRLLVRTDKVITVDLDRLEKQLFLRFNRDDQTVVSSWITDFYTIPSNKD